MEYISELVNEALFINDTVFTLNLFGINIPISETLITVWIASLILIIFCILASRNLKKIPGKFQAAIELLVEFVNNLSKERVGHNWRVISPFLLAMLLFIGFTNLIGIFNAFPTSAFFSDVLGWDFFKNIPSFEIKAPSKDINIPFTLAISSMIMLIYATIRCKGLKGFGKTLVDPMPIMLPFKILDYVIRPLSLTLRLFGNVLAAYVIMEIIMLFVPIALPGVLSIYFDIFDGLLQAYIFVFLSSLYMAENLE